MTKHDFADLLGGIDPALVARAEAPLPLRKKPHFRRAVIVLAAALLVLISLLSVAVIAYFPKTYDLDYEVPKHEYANKIAQIYYAEDGKIKRQSVLLPPTAENIFMTWQHLNDLENDAALIEIASTEGAYPDREVIMTLSATLRDHPESEALLTSLKSTFAAYYGIPKKNVTFYFAKDPVTLEFSYDLTDTSIRLKSGDTFTVTLTMTNISDEDIVFEGAESDFVPKAKLLVKSLDYVVYEILPEAHDTTTEIAEYRLAPGESKSFTYTFRIPYATSSVIITGHDLTVYFGEQSKTFENVIAVSYYFAASQARSKFESFTLEHTSEDRTELESIWDSYTYQGKNIMEQISVWSGDGENYWFEQGEYNQFSYYSDGAQMQYGWLSCYSQSFTARVLPEGMTLPMGITEQDSVLDALLKMGVDKQTALEYLGQQDTITLAGTSFLDGTSSTIPDFRTTIDLVCNPDNYVIECTVEKSIIAASDPYPHAKRTVSLTYDRESQRFLSVRIGVNLPIRPNVTFDALPVFTVVAGKDCEITLTREQADLLDQAMTQGKWQPYEADTEYDCQGMIGDIAFKYSTVTGQLTVGKFTVQLYGNDMIELNKHLGINTHFTIE
ncbi:MAG: hypothetical protein IJW70_01375 [Clostridia bacterium]|nr:hypothetical protein [Clostridia bacterium]